MIGLLAGLVVLALAVGGFMWFGSGSGTAGGQATGKPSTETVAVLVAKKEIPVGTTAAALAALVETKVMAKSAASSDALNDLQQVAGKSTNAVIPAGGQITLGKFIAGASGANTVAAMPSGTVELFMSFSGIQAANGTIRPGQQLSIFVTMKDETGKSTTQRAFSHLLVTRAFPNPAVATTTTGGSGTPASPAASAAPTGAASTVSAAPTTATSPSPAPSSTAARSSGSTSVTQILALAVTPRDGARLIAASHSGEMWLAVENDESPSGYGPKIAADGVLQ